MSIDLAVIFIHC